MKTITIHNPYTLQPIETLHLHSREEAFQKLEISNQLFLNRKKWIATHERRSILEKFISILVSKKSTFIEQATLEGGKPLKDSEIEIDRGIEGIKIALAELFHWEGKQIPMGLTASSQHKVAWTLKEPKGVVLAISAFNHPFNLIIHQVIPAIAVGCPVLVKPSLETPLSCISILNALYEAGLPKEWAQLLLTENHITEDLVKDHRVSFLTFIGSSKVGWHLRSLLAPGSTCALEHGGAAPLIVDKEVPIRDYISGIAKAGFYHAGQVCVSAQRIFVHETLVADVSKELVKIAKTLKTGDPLKPGIDIGPLIRPQETKRIHTWVQNAIQEGAICLTGGTPIGTIAYEPTVLLNPDLNSLVSTKEIFGPVICIYAVSNMEEAIQKANALPYCFQAAVYTPHLDTAFYATTHLKAKTVLVNEHTAFRVDWMPFGGRGESGLGTGGIGYSMADMTHEKLIIFQSPSIT